MRLRDVIAGAAALLVVAALGAAIVWPGQWPLLAMALILAWGTIFERRRYRARDGSPGGGWRRTDERFVDPESGQAMTVWFDPATGDRRYVADE